MREGGGNTHRGGEVLCLLGFGPERARVENPFDEGWRRRRRRRRDTWPLRRRLAAHDGGGVWPWRRAAKQLQTKVKNAAIVGERGAERLQRT